VPRMRSARIWGGIPFVIAAGVVLVSGCSDGASLRAELDQLKSREAALAAQVATLEGQRASYEEIAAAQNALAHTLQQRVDSGLGDNLAVTEGVFTQLPKTMEEAKAQGYVLLDTMSPDGKKVEQAQCFSHGDALHFGKPLHSMTTEGSTWHGAPLLVIYSSTTGKIMGMVLESTSPQPDSLWEHHTKGHNGMPFEHWSLHFWFTDPPKA